MEAVATVLSLAVGCIALVRFYSNKNNMFLFIGTGFVATAFSGRPSRRLQLLPLY